jgi:uroporphyrinogen-III synthase
MTKLKMPLNIVVTRPLPQGKQLVEKLNAAGYTALSQPFFDIKSNAEQTDIKQLLAQTNAQFFIFVSVAAVEFADQAWSLKLWQQPQSTTSFIAVGEKTKAALLNCGLTTVISPSQQNSEGLLALNELQDVKNKDIIIVRGDQGRELLAKQLSASGANVHYLSSYQKIWRSLNCNELVNQWKKTAINCIVVTSIALLEQIIKLLAQNSKDWQKNYHWVVISERIATKAQQLGLNNINVADNASDQAIINTITTIKN